MSISQVGKPLHEFEEELSRKDFEASPRRLDSVCVVYFWIMSQLYYVGPQPGDHRSTAHL